MIVLGINQSHTATAALVKDGKVVACVSEERFTRKKAQGGFPRQSIAFCLKQGRISTKDIDLVVFGYIDVLSSYLYSAKTQGGQYMPALVRVKSAGESLFGNIAVVFPAFGFFCSLIARAIHKTIGAFVRWIHVQRTARLLGILKSKIVHIDHHTAHAWAAYAFSKPNKNASCLILTNDASGDDTCSRIFTVTRGKWNELASVPNEHSLGYVYWAITKFLGFTPNEDEYKVMGLAGYVDADKVNKIYPIFSNLIVNKGLGYLSKIPPFAYGAYVRRKLGQVRFDVVSGAVQRLSETVLASQARAAIEKSSIHHLTLGGGLAMNIKANMAIAGLPGVSSLTVCPGSGDESTAIGCCWWGYDRLKSRKPVKGHQKLTPLSTVYLGPSYTDRQIKAALEEVRVSGNSDYRVTKLAQKDVIGRVAALLAHGHIVARFAGRMEFGPRALGNRSILADPRHAHTLQAINKIKGRDFWMPCAPTILAEYAHEYLVNPKRLKSPFMMLAFETLQKAREHIPACLHPADYTCRPQILSRSDNPVYWKIIDAFAKKTGVGAVLNTSFNIHGQPIVCSPADALFTLKHSSLKFFVLENYVIEKIR